MESKTLKKLKYYPLLYPLLSSAKIDSSEIIICQVTQFILQQERQKAHENNIAYEEDTAQGSNFTIEDIRIIPFMFNSPIE